MIIDESEFTRLVKERVDIAQRRMAEELSKALFSGDVMPSDYVYIPPTRIERLVRFFRDVKNGIRYRVIGTYNLWTKGECKYCEHDDYY